ncbi:active regulator of SIRT1 isoform X2 [Aplysia californica]|uniref:Active regulator of SIRT1 n=1 Tax=Aplysia californica TaxID=6500 RepID=A0ABM1VPB7_APLCA|nr:active regulator of SIRT1 isoform X2 [Aplysia californica]
MLEPTMAAKSGKKKKGYTTNDAMELIKTNRQGVWKELRKLQKTHKKDVMEKRKKKKFKSAIELYKEQNDVDYTEANVEALQKITELGKVRDEVAEKILYKQPNRLSRDIKEKEVEEEESTVFTEEDFQKFAREYRPK